MTPEVRRLLGERRISELATAPHLDALVCASCGEQLGHGVISLSIRVVGRTHRAALTHLSCPSLQVGAEADSLAALAAFSRRAEPHASAFVDLLDVILDFDAGEPTDLFVAELIGLGLTVIADFEAPLSKLVGWKAVLRADSAVISTPTGVAIYDGAFRVIQPDGWPWVHEVESTGTLALYAGSAIGMARGAPANSLKAAFEAGRVVGGIISEVRISKGE